jgi:molecular chaperone DnaK (HSP70)
MAWFNPKTGQAEILKNAEGEEKTPSVVYFGPDGVQVGNSAEHMIEDEEERRWVHCSIKRHLGSNMRVSLRDGRLATPVEIAAEILKKLKHDAEAGHFHGLVERVVLTCPAAFNEVERAALEEAGHLAGFETVELLEEPVAAAFADEHDGASIKGWRIWNEQFGIVADCWAAFLVIRPMYIYVPR